MTTKIKISLFIILLLLFPIFIYGQYIGKVINLNGKWDFDQTTNAFPPEQFTRKCPVPGLISLAEPRIDEYDKIFKKPDDLYDKRYNHDYRDLNYQPKYSWYRKMVFIPDELDGAEAVLTIRKSQYVTHVFVNGFDVGQSISCYTPIDLKITEALNFGKENEILIRVGERIWLPPSAAGSTDKEKEHYIPGIWDDVYISFSGKQKVLKNLILPSVKNKTVTAKLLIRNFYPQQILGSKLPKYSKQDSVKAEITIKEKISGKKIATGGVKGVSLRDNETKLIAEIPLKDFITWSPENSFLYQAEIKLFDKDVLSDSVITQFGMRDFGVKGKYFYLNGEKYYLRGSNINLQRFFTDPECRSLPWNREWVKKMLIEQPKSINWNAMRICLGIVPDFWYDLADEYGIVFQNEWFYWQKHGWDEQIRKEYTDWVWSDGDHPSIVIWDAINENRDNFIGNELIPELQNLDPTRIWDNGWMQQEDLTVIDLMDEPHLYRAYWDLMLSADPLKYLEEKPYLLGKIDDWPEKHLKYLEASATQLVNEYGWNWLWRDGRPAKLTKNMYDHLLGEDASVKQRRAMQAYWLECETEWIRPERTMAGVLVLGLLTNNYGYTGDLYINNIKDLETSISFDWLKHAFFPGNVFIDVADQRYFPNGYHKTGSLLAFDLVAVNDLKDTLSGTTTVKLIQSDGEVIDKNVRQVQVKPYGRSNIPTFLTLPNKTGGYLILSEFIPKGTNEKRLSRRYIKVGKSNTYHFYEIDP